MTTEAETEAFNRLCLSCKHMEPREYVTWIMPVDGPCIEVKEVSEKVECRGSLRPLTSDGQDCPYFQGIILEKH